MHIYCHRIIIKFWITIVVNGERERERERDGKEKKNNTK